MPFALCCFACYTPFVKLQSYAILRFGVLVLGIIWHLTSSEAQAQSTHQAREYYLAADFRKAILAFEKLLESPTLRAADAAIAHAYLATLRWLEHDYDVAKDHAEAAVAANPAQTAPEGSPPALGRIFAELAKHPARLRIKTAAPKKSSAATVVTATLDPVPRLLVTAMLLECKDTEARVVSDESPPPSVSVHLPGTGGGNNCVAEAKSTHGAALFRKRLYIDAQGSPLMANRSPLLAKNSNSNGKDEGFTVPTWIWIGAGVLVAAAGVTTAAILLSNQQNEAEISGTRIEGW